MPAADPRSPPTEQADHPAALEREWFRVTLASIGDAVITTDTDSVVTYLNPVAEKMTGWTCAEARGQPLSRVFRIFNESTRAEAVNPVAKVLAEGAIVGLANHTVLVNRQGQETAIEDSAAPIRNQSGRIVGVVMVFHDIDARRRAERALERSEKLLADFFANAPVGLKWIEASGRILRVNRAELEILGCTESECVGRDWREFHVEPAVADEIQHILLAGGAVENRAAAIRIRDGSIRDVLISANAFVEDGHFVHGRCFMRDVTEQRRAEAARAHLAALVTSSDDAIISKSLTGVIQTWNAGAERIFGYTAAEAVGQPITILIPPDRQDEEPAILERLKRGERVDHFQTIRRRKDGTLLDISLSISPILDAQGRVIGASKIARDISDRVRAEQLLRQEHAVTEQLYRLAQSLATELEPTRIAQLVADAGTRITRAEVGVFFHRPGEGQPPPALSGLDRARFDRSPLPRFLHQLAATFNGDQPQRSDDAEPGSTGEGKPALGAVRLRSHLAVPVRARSGDLLGGLLFGHARPGAFTERDEAIMAAVAAQAAAALGTAQLYEAERQARAAAESTSETKDKFIAALSHELRTPLTPVLAILGSLRDHPSLPASVAADLETARRNVLLEARLIDDLLDLTRISRGKLTLQEEVTFVEGLIETAVNTCRPDLETRRLELIRDLRASSATVLGDGARLAQVLWNLLKNAIKFTPDGGTITVRSRVERPGSGDQVVIEVEDTGVGIEAEALPRIFSAFEQGGQETTRRFGGLGLGLAISRAIVLAHRGRLEATSPGRDRGSKFTVTLPLFRRPAAREDAGEATGPAADPAVPAMPPVRILLVEDHADTAAIMRRILTSWGHTVLHARTVADALRIADQEKGRAGLSLVISDLGLPDGSGLDLMRTLSSRHGLTGIALSGYGMESDLKQSAAAGFVRHLTKPVDLHLLRMAVHAIVSGGSAPPPPS